MFQLTNWLYKYPVIFLILFSALILLPFTGNVHLFDWDEINFAECAREMIVNNSYHTPMINFQPFWEKPPLFIWMQVLSMKIFGINEFAARFPNMLNGIITLWLLYYFGKRWYNKQFGILWAIIHLGTFLPHLYFRSGIIDPWYNLFAFLFYAGLLDFLHIKKFSWLILGSIALGLAVLTKGPAMLLVMALSILLLFAFYRQKFVQTLQPLSIAFIVFILTGASWFLFEYISGNKEIIYAFIDYQIRLFKTEDSGHGGFFLYHVVVILIGCFPASVLMLNFFSKKNEKDFFSKAMFFLLLVVLVIFSIVKTKIVHYSSMAYYPVSFLSAYVLIKNFSLNKLQKFLLIFIGSIISLILILAGNIEKWKNMIIPYLKKTDSFASENLSVQVNWYGWEWLLGLFLLGIILWYVLKNEYSFKKQITFFLMLIFWINLTINNYVGKVEQYTQFSAISFCRYCADKNYIVDSYGYKSYAPLFYGNRKPLSDIQKKEIDEYLKSLENSGFPALSAYNLAYMNWLISSDEYPAFLVCKIQDEQNVLNTGKFVKLYSKGGYVFFMKQKPTP